MKSVYTRLCDLNAKLIVLCAATDHKHNEHFTCRGHTASRLSVECYEIVQGLLVDVDVDEEVPPVVIDIVTREDKARAGNDKFQIELTVEEILEIEQALSLASLDALCAVNEDIRDRAWKRFGKLIEENDLGVTKQRETNRGKPR